MPSKTTTIADAVATTAAAPTVGAGDNEIRQPPIMSRDFESLTNVDEIRECLRLLDQEETRIDVSLDNMLAKETLLEQSLSALDALRFETPLDSKKKKRK